MQRIDENTYIDDTLVTCAEYQLFLDEMRKQGKYYQPDHWVSYQFPEGMGRLPILGIRPSDALAFSAWCTQNEKEGWVYELPTEQQTRKSPLPERENHPIGYWARTEKKEICFLWVDDPPKDARNLTNIVNTVILQDPFNWTPYQAIKHTIEGGLNIDLAVPRLLGAVKNNVSELSHESLSASGDIFNEIQEKEWDTFSTPTYRTMYQIFGSFSENIESIARALGFSLFAPYFAGNIDLSSVAQYEMNIKKAFETICDLANSIGISVNETPGTGQDTFDMFNIFEYSHNPKISKGLNSVLNCISDFHSNITILDHLTSTRDFGCDTDIDLGQAAKRFTKENIELAIDILTLQERIAGRSPAFEGIRLIKERIR
jgi:hypothetical protein